MTSRRLGEYSAYLVNLVWNVAQHDLRKKSALKEQHWMKTCRSANIKAKANAVDVDLVMIGCWSMTMAMVRRRRAKGRGMTSCHGIVDRILYWNSGATSNA